MSLISVNCILCVHFRNHLFALLVYIRSLTTIFHLNISPISTILQRKSKIYSIVRAKIVSQFPSQFTYILSLYTLLYLKILNFDFDHKKCIHFVYSSLNFALI